ncbi:FecR family protein [Dyadobacter psychrotolerans]|uniref:DUF4974 domain-containing protein n=1 Tax=Dyadobacter psychrotolerans TaxID=2541721 RepID=A0A4R5DI77_9BACT|nr:FecR domain-containing protein [Dyadobacter psychrotolerans]TDE10203.1 DUF4974 domain-containing protein [Dyadobacter psychrotolerans]
MTDPKLLSRLVERYYTNQATTEELEVFIDLQKKGVLDEALNDYLEGVIKEEAIQPEASFQHQPKRGQLMMIAASVSLLLLTGFLAMWALKGINEVNYVQVQTDQFKEKQIRLSDGSLVVLNRNSAFAYPEKWSGESRDVKLLSGEAYFEIKQNKKYQSFIVHTPDDFKIDVLGTEFNISSKNGQTKVYLESGKVKVERHGQKSVLKPGELAEYDKETGQITVQQANGELWLAWKNDMFFFDDATLSDIGKTLEDYYHKNVIIENESLASLRFTGKISRNNIDMVLKILSRTLNIDIMHHKDQIIMENSEKVYRHAD